ncbi:MAG: hypothetical protein GF320_19560 [Armatimonadia bacterium]|nr:hypothetical protein [Armatimonadia bacterium]
METARWAAQEVLDRMPRSPILACLAVLLAMPVGAQDVEGFWLDMYHAEPTDGETLMDDLVQSEVIYLGETHSVDRHHALQTWVVEQLVAREVPFFLAMEQAEFFHQNHLDRYNAGDVDFDALVEAMDWESRWSNIQDYRQLIETAHAADAPIVGINARAETIRAIGRGGLESLGEVERGELPHQLWLGDPDYRRLLKLQLPVHAGMPEEVLDQVCDAQIARDATMADRIVRFMDTDEGEGRIAVVIAGSGHVSFGLGTPDRVRTLLPQVRDRIVLFTVSGELELSPQEEAMAAGVTITHEDLRSLGRTVADYVHAKAEEEPSPPRPEGDS